MAERPKTVKNLYVKLWPFVWLTKILGLLPWRMNGDRLTIAGIPERIYVWIVFSMWSYWFFSSLISFTLATFNQDPKMFEHLVIVYATSQIMLNMYQEMTDPYTGIRIIEALGQYDRRVEVLGHGRRDCLANIWTTLTVFAVTFVSAATSSLERRYNGETDFELLSERVTLLSIGITQLKFCIMTNLLFQRYRHLNESMVPDASTSAADNSGDRPTVTIHDVACLHAILVRATTTLANRYSRQILLWYASCVNVALQLLYLAIRVHDMSVTALQVVYCTLQIVTISWTCHRTALEANKFGYVLLRTSGDFKRSFNSALAIDAAMYVSNHRVGFTAGSLLPANLSTILQVTQLTLHFSLIAFK